MLDKYLKSAGFLQCSSDPCIYHRTHSELGKCIIVVYVDDLLIAATTKQMSEVKANLKLRFKMSDLGPAKSILGMEIIRDQTAGSLTLKQGRYIREILAMFGLEDCKPAATPIDPNMKLKRPDATPEDAIELPYPKAVGKLNYAATGTRPDLAYTVGFASRFLHAYDKQQWAMVQRVLHYLRGTTSYAIKYD